MQSSEHSTLARRLKMLGVACEQRGKKVVATFQARDRAELATMMGTASTAAVEARAKTVLQRNKVRRNDPCPCNSGRKYKRCCRK